MQTSSFLLAEQLPGIDYSSPQMSSNAINFRVFDLNVFVVNPPTASRPGLSNECAILRSIASGN
jgi:hypothetical protein